MQKRILLVDDDESTAFFLGENLAELGPTYQVETSCSGEEALGKIARQPFDLIITDLRMPGISGLELLQQVRDVHPQTRLILMTAYGSRQVETQARRLKLDGYITKPFQIEELIDAARKALSNRPDSRPSGVSSETN